ncbi:phage terminase large subunit [Metaclostridioides mangenotii]|uniref:phage terminase large subunit n=1 Tax=Metaclostridioides mangenotii TaxID=1540 RepID=UPI002ED5DBB9
MDEDAFNMLDESIRGEVSKDLFKQLTLTFNPWNEHHWIKGRFFDDENDPDIMAKTTNFTFVTSFLTMQIKKVFERMKRDNPRRYQVAGLGVRGSLREYT